MREKELQIHLEVKHRKHPVGELDNRQGEKEKGRNGKMMQKLHIHNTLLEEFEQYKKLADYCVPKGSNNIGSNFDCRWKFRSLADEIKFAKKFREFKKLNEEAWKEQFRR